MYDPYTSTHTIIRVTVKKRGNKAKICGNYVKWKLIFCYVNLMLPKTVTHVAQIVCMLKNCNIIVRRHPIVFISILLKIDAICDRSDMWHCNVAARGVAGTLEGSWSGSMWVEAATCPTASVERLGPSSQDATQGMSSIFYSISIDFKLSALTKPSQCH